MLNAATIGNAGPAMLDRWREAVARYSAARSHFQERAGMVAPALTMEQSAYVRELQKRADAVESAIARVADWLHTGRDIWSAVKPIADSVGLTPKAARYAPAAGVACLALATRFLDSTTRQLDDANRHMDAITVQQ